MFSQNFRIIPGDPRSTIIMHVPHSSREIPNNIRTDILLNDKELEDELNEITDTATDLIAIEAAKSSRIRPWLFVNQLSRLVIDPERFPDNREEMNSLGLAAVYLQTSQGRNLRGADFRRDDRLMNQFFYPYAKGIEDLISLRLQALNEVTILDIHSYRTQIHPNGLNQTRRRPEICIGTNRFHTHDLLRMAATKAFAGIGDLLENEPYSGTYVPLSFYEVEPRIGSLMLEIRADTFLNPDLTKSEGFIKIVGALRQLIDHLAHIADQ
jgi:N-formylglutamate deformylase